MFVWRQFCSSDDSTALTGTVTVQLMSGSDPNNLSLVDTIATGLAASAGKVSYTPATTLPFGTYYAIRITSSVDGPHYSHFFAAGNPDVTEAPSSSAASTTASATAPATTSATASAPASHKTSELGSLSEDSDATEASSAKPKTTSDKASATKSKATSSAKPTSSEEEEESSSAKPSKAESSSHSNGASRPALAAGLLGVAVFAAMF
ncbi:hypothetical protein DL89DRAFT_253670 [Linderina pennispora]|uniref:Yeast cell wall synthesis Kre9/Knh1-like N-terminal domain-containing protein n=1 Tax=Linderina pennispora TaxID=61395 RepID=A0A1Y1WJM8_9FUNG|nr:uncharacterized protein DL89DRAFT_253670 [Linderina pennispora]ORX73737.1 hypothetical protein DL89DRAFT_253670 [Linderina pennispora]